MQSQEQEKDRQKRKSLWKDDVASALEKLGGEANLNDLYEAVAAIRSDLPDAWKSAIRKTLQFHNPDSPTYYRPAAALFYRNKSGRWGLRKKIDL